MGWRSAVLDLERSHLNRLAVHQHHILGRRLPNLQRGAGAYVVRREMVNKSAVYSVEKVANRNARIGTGRRERLPCTMDKSHTFAAHVYM